MEYKEYLIENLGFDYKETGDNIMYNCPFCNDHKHDYKLSFKKSKDSSNGIWQCWRCGRKGNFIGFVMKYEGISFLEAKDVLELYGFDESGLTKEHKEAGLTEEESLYLLLNDKPSKESNTKTNVPLKPPPLPVGYKRIVDNLNDPEVIPFIEYLCKVRNIPPDNLQLHNIGYITKGYTKTEQGGIVNLNNHIVFLTHGDNGEYIYWNTRSIENNPGIKSFNASARDDEYSKRNTLFNLNRAIQTNQIVLVEGVIDALTIGESGIASFGKKVTTEQIDIITENIHPNQTIYIMLDDDARTEMNQLAKEIHKQHEETYIVMNGTGKDPNDMGQEETWNKILHNSVKASQEGLLLFNLT